MNLTEKKMVEILKELKEKHACFGVKAEFEAEGTRTEELMRLKEICMKAKVTLNLKIGGCEAIRDMYDARIIGVDNLIAPMVESVFSLHKYMRAIDIVFPKDEQKKIGFLINVETFQTTQVLEEMLRAPHTQKLAGVVLGRVDMTGSMGLDRKAVNSDEVFALSCRVFEAAKAHHKICALGGAVSAESIPFLKRFNTSLLDRYETRKVCFTSADALKKDPEKSIFRAVEFELLWLKNKQNFYRAIAEEDQKRILMLDERLGGAR